MFYLLPTDWAWHGCVLGSASPETCPHPVSPDTRTVLYKKWLDHGHDWDSIPSSSALTSTTSAPRRCITSPYCSSFPFPLSRGISTTVTPVLKHLPTVTPRSARIALRWSNPCTSNLIQALWLTIKMSLADAPTIVAFHHSTARRITASGLSGWRISFPSPPETSPCKVPHTRPCKSPMCYSVRRSAFPSSVNNRRG